MNSKLLEAVEIFKELGWENVNTQNVLELPLGTADQKKTALAGLKSGDFGEIGQIGENSYGWISFVDVDEGQLALFAVRLGVDARRAANLLTNADNDLIVAVLAERGPKYAANFIEFACISKRRIYEHSASLFGNAAVKLVDKLNIDIPRSVEYMKDWAVYAATAMNMKAEIRYNETNLPALDIIKRRFVEHIKTGVSVNTPATGPFGAVLPAGVKNGWLPREEAVDLVFTALDASVRPGDRKVWMEVLDELNITDNELYLRVQGLIPIIATGDTAMITRLIPSLIKQTDERLINEILMATLSVKTKNAKKLILKSALEGPAPADKEGIEPWLTIMRNDKDSSIANLAKKLMEKWSIAEMDSPEISDEILGLWRETPPLWQVPQFQMGEPSPEELTEILAKLTNQASIINDVTMEKFLAMANAVAYKNADEAKASLAGIKWGNWQIFDFLSYWANGEEPKYGFDKSKDDVQYILVARDYVITQNLDKLPCILSTPSTIDLSIKFSDLVNRLSIYKKYGIDAFESDLLLALFRLDLDSTTDSDRKKLKELDVSVVLQSGEKMSDSAGEIVSNYIDDPMKEPIQNDNEHLRLWEMDLSMPASLKEFPNRIIKYYSDTYAIFPHWGDIALDAVVSAYDVYHEQGLIARQVARRSTPLPPGASINILSAQRSMTPDAAEDTIKAGIEAFERGLLIPGVADVRLLDWNPGAEPSNLKALSDAFGNIARDGMLSVVWPLIDDIVSASLKAPRLITGTSEMVQLALDLLPEVKAAVEKGLADISSLNLPAIRTLAKKSGSSQAVKTAQKLAKALPKLDNKEIEEKDTTNDIEIMDPPFDEVWSEEKNEKAFVDDGIEISVGIAEPDAKKKLLLFNLSLPGISDKIYQVVKSGWYYDLDSEKQCQAYTAAPGTTTFTGNRENQVWLHWNNKKNKMEVSNHRNWPENKDGPLYRQGLSLSMTNSFFMIVIGLLAQDGDATYYVTRIVEEYIEKGEIGADTVKRAIKLFLKYPDISPAKLVRNLEKDVKLLPVFWPMLTESVKFAGALVASNEAPPVWINRILDIALRFSPYIIEATKRGYISKEDSRWAGLEDIATAKSKSAAVKKAKKLQEKLGV